MNKQYNKKKTKQNKGRHTPNANTNNRTTDWTRREEGMKRERNTFTEGINSIKKGKKREKSLTFSIQIERAIRRV